MPRACVGQWRVLIEELESGRVWVATSSGLLARTIGDSWELAVQHMARNENSHHKAQG